ncbi:MAG TPA: biliverdin-producing heme oxygenase [Terrimesophilobacter sp.]|nr:biliverdin-producing heme oxygenase [Terrimesophilobacter sp.]
MTTAPFSQALRERTWNTHNDTEGATFMSDLMRGAGTRDDYIALVAQHYFMYEALERVEQRFRDHPETVGIITSRLTRLPHVAADLEYLIGADWRTEISPTPATERYVARIENLDWAGGFIAHHYTRYLGDLSGGQHIYKVMQRRFDLGTDGVRFYLFDDIADPTEFKNDYRAALDAITWTPDETERVINEVIAAYELNTEVFRDLSAAKAALVA